MQSHSACTAKCQARTRLSLVDKSVESSVLPTATTKSTPIFQVAQLGAERAEAWGPGPRMPQDLRRVCRTAARISQPVAQLLMITKRLNLGRCRHTQAICDAAQILSLNLEQHGC